LIGDLFPAGQRSKALSVFMLGLPVGIALSYLVSSLVAHRYGWRAAFWVAGVPGLLLAGAALLLREPKRGAAEMPGVGARRRAGSCSPRRSFWRGWRRRAARWRSSRPSSGPAAR